MFIAKHNDLIILARDTQEELEADLKFMSYDSIEETDIEYKLVNGVYMTAQEAEAKERERINMLSLTKREVFLALYKDKGITPEQIRAQIKDPAALIEFDYANDYFRGNPLIDSIGEALGYSSEDLDYLFENGELPEKEDTPAEEDASEAIGEGTENVPSDIKDVNNSTNEKTSEVDESEE